MSDATAIRCERCACQLPARAGGHASCPRCDAARPTAPPAESFPDDPASLRRVARLRGLREAGLLLSLVAVMAVTAYYSWHGALESSRIGPPDAGDDPPDAAAAVARAFPTAPDGAGRSPRVARPLPVPPGAPRLGPASPAIGTAPEAPPAVVAADDLDATEAPKAPALQQPEDEPRLPMRSAPLDLTRIEELPVLRTPIDLSGIAPAFLPPAPIDPDSPTGPPPARPTRLLVGDASGRVLVSRLYATGPEGTVVQLPDGSLGWPDGEVATDRPFRPWTARQVGNALLNGRYRGFRPIERPPYLVLTEGSDAFAERAADLLQSLYEQLSACLAEGGIPVSEPEFPLVAIIHRDEASFRRARQVDPDVRAYYEVASNRIVLFESSDQDHRAPELAALGRPQTIAHEGVHQILQNIGVQPRLASWPCWLVEGLAEYYAPTAPPPAPTAPDDPRAPWGDYGRANFGRVNPLHMATLLDLRDPGPPLALLRGPGPGPATPAWGRPVPDEPWLTRLMLRDELAPTDYALAWSLTHYLARNHPDAFRSYLLALGRRRPLEPRSPEQHLKDFVSHFGAHPAALSRRIDRHLASLRYERVPFYAVRFEQAMANGLVRRGVFVSPSPTMITQWLHAQALPEGAPLVWWATPFDSRNRARLFCEAWLLNSFP